MPQKTLTSFFKKPLEQSEKTADKPLLSDEDTKKVKLEESPIKKPKRKRVFIESEDEENESPEKSRPSKKSLVSSEIKCEDRAPSPEKSSEVTEPNQNSSEKETVSPKKEKTSPKKEKPSPKKEKPSPKKKKLSPKKENPSPESSKLESEKHEDTSASPTKDYKCVPVNQYDPSKTNYHPIKDASWKEGDKVPYLAFTLTLEKIESISGRLKIIECLGNFFRSVGILSPKDFSICVNLSLNQIYPAYEGIEMGIGESLILKAICQTSGSTLQKLKTELQSVGDLGNLALKARSKQSTMSKPKPLTIDMVFQRFREISNLSGHSSQNKKVDIIARTLVACQGHEAKFLVRALQGKLRIGLAEQSVISALGYSIYHTPFHMCKDFNSVLEIPKSLLGKNSSDLDAKEKMDQITLLIKTAFCQRSNFERVVNAVLEEDVDKILEKCSVEPGIPMRPMLAHPTNGVADVLKRFDECEFTCEFKYDGERAQIHLLPDGSVRIYSRNQENNTQKYPDVISAFNDHALPNTNVGEDSFKILANIDKRVEASKEEIVNKQVKSFIIDSEAVAWDKEKNQILPFQILSTRKRKDVKEDDIKVQVCIYVFDLLYINGVSLVQVPMRQRRDLLHGVFKEIPGKFTFAKHLDSCDTETIGEFLEESVKGNCEGLMVKTLDDKSTYEIAKRSRNWLKLKKDYLDGVGDTLDLVPIAAFYGAGKRTGVYGAFLLACYEPETEQYQSICKLGTGLSDEELKKFTEELKETVIAKPRSYYQISNHLNPDVWFETSRVWEIKAADFSISPNYMAAAGMADPVKGISLRFPRFVRVREDKKCEMATSSSQVYDIYMNQEQIKNQTNTGANEEDYY